MMRQFERSLFEKRIKDINKARLVFQKCCVKTVAAVHVMY
jgi:hypothetical protein